MSAKPSLWRLLKAVFAPVKTKKGGKAWCPRHKKFCMEIDKNSQGECVLKNGCKEEARFFRMARSAGAVKEKKINNKDL